MWNFKYNTNEPTYETETNSKTWRTDFRLPRWGGRMREGWSGSLGLQMPTILYIGQINNNVLLDSTGNYIQYPMISHNGKEYEKECIYV